LIVSCSSCGAKYRYDEVRFEGKPTKKLRCTKCDTVFAVANPWGEGRVAERVSDNPPDLTHTRRTGGDEPGEEPPKERLIPVPESRVPAGRLELPAGKKLSLAVIAGVDQGRTFPVTKPRMVLGRRDADIVLNDTEISRNHAAIEVSEGEVFVVDLGSTNGILVDGERVESAALENYGEFEIGGSTLMLIVTVTA